MGGGGGTPRKHGSEIALRHNSHEEIKGVRNRSDMPAERFLTPLISHGVAEVVQKQGESQCGED
jgi:hypothetical protein